MIDVRTAVIKREGEQVGVIKMPDDLKIAAYAYDDAIDGFGCKQGQLHGTQIIFDMSTPVAEIETAVLNRVDEQKRVFAKLSARWTIKHG